MKENSNLRKRKYEQKERAHGTNKSSFMENLDDIHLFLPNIARTTKILPRTEQTAVKISVSNTVLQAELRCSEKEYFSSSSPRFVTTPQQPFFSPQDYSSRQDDRFSNSSTFNYSS
ncbi:hypothetical protein HHI36_002799 [Cryptolaemus montrouzieri]|uniref:BHLH domain-containing protein n=1 Tax=Cryptolaemus montrouzieri TaxID=559131 RepID=A0ABD2PCG9_9CUCU